MQEADLRVIYSHSLHRLSEHPDARTEWIHKFIAEFSDPSWFPSFLRELGIERDIWQLADLEWNLAGRSVDKQSLAQSNVNRLQLNPQVRICRLDQDIDELHFKKGIYLFSEGQWLKIEKAEAEILDLLAEEFDLTSEKVIAYFENRPQYSEALERLCEGHWILR